MERECYSERPDDGQVGGCAIADANEDGVENDACLQRV